MNEAPGSAPPRPSTEFSDAFRFFFEDLEWLPKLLMGTLFTLLSVFVIGSIWVTGYVVGIVRRRMRDEPRPLPDWSDLHGLFVDGLKAWLVAAAHTAPLVFLTALLGLSAGGTFGVLESAGHVPAEIRATFVLFVLTAYVFLMLVGIALMLYLPAAFVRFVVIGRLSAAFDIRENINLIRRNARAYFQALLVIFASSFVAQLGFFVLCIGFFPAAFWSACVFGYAVGGLARGDELLLAQAAENRGIVS